MRDRNSKAGSVATEPWAAMVRRRCTGEAGCAPTRGVTHGSPSTTVPTCLRPSTTCRPCRSGPPGDRPPSTGHWSVQNQRGLSGPFAIPRGSAGLGLPLLGRSSSHHTVFPGPSFGRIVPHSADSESTRAKPLPPSAVRSGCMRSGSRSESPSDTFDSQPLVPQRQHEPSRPGIGMDDGVVTNSVAIKLAHRLQFVESPAGHAVTHRGSGKGRA